MNFRLTYDGPLKAASQSETRRVEKHAMRRVFSDQLGMLMAQARRDLWDTEVQKLGFQREKFTFKRGDCYFFAVVRSSLHLVCDLDILFLRREPPGQLICGGGDLDNRIKVLFDALRIPQDENEIRDCITEDDHLMVCLTEDDRLITGFRVTTDRLLQPPQTPSEENHVRLIINVEVKPTKLTEENLGYFSHF